MPRFVAHKVEKKRNKVDALSRGRTTINEKKKDAHPRRHAGMTKTNVAVVRSRRYSRRSTFFPTIFLKAYLRPATYYYYYYYC